MSHPILVRILFTSILIVCLLGGFREWSSASDAAPTQRAVHPAQHATMGPRSAALARIITQPLPERNLYALADELRLHPPRHIAHVIRRSSPNYPVGHRDRFYILSEDKNRYFTIHATIKAETPHLYIYFEDGLNVNQATVQKAADTFERSIYPTDRSFFGSEWTPGVDHDPHITCLFANLRSSAAAGFFSAEDEYPHLVNPWSNQRNMIYINAPDMAPGDPAFNQTVAHEFQHMIHWHMHPRDNAWLNEGMSMLAEQVNHYPPVSEPSAFFAMPTTQLNTWTLSGDSSVAHYGAAYLYLLYLYERFGRGLIHTIVADRKYTDFELIDDALRQRHIHQTALQIFTKWVVANVVNDRSVAKGIYGYSHIGDKVNVTRVESVPFSFSGSVPPYAAQYLSVTAPSKPFRLQFSAPSSVPVVSIAQSGPFWWGNRGDMSDTSLTRTVDLRRVHHAVLHFQTSYDIEKDYDYAYVEASTDGGKTWQTLPGSHTTTSNPFGASYGNAYTGDSKGWLAERVDLSAYAGRRILMRFQYITDDEYNGQGFVVKNITIPEIGFHDTYAGWQERGFVPVGANALPSQWVVQLVAYTANRITVSRLPLHGQQGSVLINPASQGLKKLVVVVFTAAPKTTVGSTYQVSAVSS